MIHQNKITYQNKNITKIETNIGNLIFNTANYKRIKNYHWYANKNSNGQYGVRSINEKKRENLTFWRILFNVPDIKIAILQKNGNKLDFRNKNVKFIPITVRAHLNGKHKNNTSGYKGVYWARKERRWKSVVRINRKTKTLGYFRNIEVAFNRREKVVNEYISEYIN